ncbi:MAG: prepilin-type N-terminal cleavage/methylation domain-containing protein [Candidatus Nealsonbacteria bacterium]|nr:prepilin-type N-terminal cleavage/methylation domain-containing protein [Candidatus Nealsonbacteria bacterium]
MKKNRSFTIIEIMLAISIFTLVISSSIVLIQQTITAVSLDQSRLIAFYLAQEGIEITRNIRDNNWLEQSSSSSTSWDDGLSNNNYEADYVGLTLSSYVSPGRFLYIDNTNGFYFYPITSCPAPQCTKTKFTRKITISKLSDIALGTDFLYIESLVQWSEKGKDHTAKVAERLYNWYGIETP